MRPGLAALLVIIAGGTLFAIAGSESTLGQASAPQADPAGRWLLTVQRFGDDELLIFEIAKTEAGLSAQTIDAQPPFVDPKIVGLRHEGGALAFAIESDGAKHPFSGSIGPDGKVRGTIRLGGAVLMPAMAARSERSKTNALDHKRMLTLRTANRDPDPAKRVEALRNLLQDDPRHPANGEVLRSIFSIAEKAKLKAEEIGKLWEDWQASAAPYGEDWLAQTRESASQALRGQKTYAELALSLAEKTSAMLPDSASPQRRADAFAILEDAATAVGKADLAKSALERKTAAEAALDEAFRRSFPPFERKPLSRPDPTKDAVAFVEAFTNSENTAAVAIDAALVGLADSSKPSDVIVIEHHLPVPSPDPLAAVDSIARAKTLNVRATPALFVNGKLAAIDGGSLRQSERAYKELTALAQKALKGTKKGSITISAVRSGDSIQIKADVKADPAQASIPSLKLRLALTEDSVKFIGGNPLRIHRRVVRAMPGGPDGQALKDGGLQFAASVKLADLQVSVPTAQPPSAPGPGVRFTLVAFLQNDADKKVSHAVAVPVGP